MILSMKKNRQIILLAILFIIFFSCRKDDLNGKYERPTWLAGKLYTQIQTNPDLSTFAQLLHISGYDTIINVSGSYTVFAPSNAAFTNYFQENPNYKSVNDMPKAEVVKLVKYHLVQNPWSREQLRELDIYGWIDTLDLNNNVPKGNKRMTLLLGKNQKYGVEYSKYKKENSNLYRTNIIDTTATAWHRRVYTDSRKYAPIFYKEYFDIYSLSTNTDYPFYFGRQFEDINDLYYCTGRISVNEMFAENGFVYTIDRVVTPMKNGIEFLSDKSGPNSFSKYYDLVGQFAELEYNEQATFKQSGAEQGLIVDSLFNLTFPQLAFNISSEKTQPPKGATGMPSNVTIRYHHGIVAPTDEAFNELVLKYLTGENNWGSLEAAPENIKRIVANSSLSANPIYLTDLQNGFQNGESDIIKIDESSIVKREYGSNCTFIGVNKSIVPRAFSSVTGPVYTQKGFSKSMFAIEDAGLLSALKRQYANYSFFVESDQNSSTDSSLIYDTTTEQFSAVMLYPVVKKIALSTEDLRILIMNHVGMDQPKGMAKKEFIKNLAGNYLIFDNVTKEVKGTRNTTYGYGGSKVVNVIPFKISTNSDNGSTYEISNWFSFGGSDIYTIISSQFPKFHGLLKKAGLSLDQQYKYSFMSDNQNYTVFAPSDSVINATNTSGMSQQELQQFVLMHFIQGDLIFTDGSSSEAYYETCRVDESSTPYNLIYTKIRIVPEIDQITIPDKTNSPITVVGVGSPKSNILTARNLSTTGTEAYPNIINNGVVHEIKNILLFRQVDNK
jgi:uncharacterized surface protein with fasciclin (FAS1) repeats